MSKPKYRPNWLSPIAQQFYDRHIKRLNLRPEQIEVFGILCQCYSDYRTEVDVGKKRLFLESFIKMARQFGMTPKTAVKDDKPPEKDELSELLGE